ncbi:MAG: RNA polymerase factor sigma-54 [Firmicutes bacterium]|nr:RNA polymerase factor sigma-54 [Bacillota bacterium]
MKQSLQLKLGQQLTMTPQLQQAIRLLQLSSLDLQQEIQDALDGNPLLEVDHDDDFAGAQDNDHNDEHDATVADTSSMETSDALQQQDIPQDLPTDSSWDDVYSASTSPAKGSVSADDDFVYQGETSQSLQDYLIWQMQLSHFSAEDEAIAQAIIDAVDEAGYLTVSLEDIQLAVEKDFPEVTDAEVCMVLKRIQRFDPIGVAARSVSECLLIQLQHMPDTTPMRDHTMAVIRDHLDLLAARDYRTLARKSKLREEQLREVMRLLHQLNPRPGESVVQRESEYVIPDVSVFKHQGRWVVELNPDSVPKLRVNEEYAALSKQAKRASDSDYIKQHVQDARWFIKSIESRNETLLKVTHAIVQRQQAFFEHGEEAMKPMVLNDIAEAIDMHESTVSRVTTQKFMHTPRGIFELKYFFSSHVSTENGGECSSTAIRALIRKLVAAESPGKPLSDSKIAELMADQGIQVARRTIAKYRESLNIPPSNQRKSLL